RIFALDLLIIRPSLEKSKKTGMFGCIISADRYIEMHLLYIAQVMGSNKDEFTIIPPLESKLPIRAVRYRPIEHLDETGMINIEQPDPMSLSSYIIQYAKDMPLGQCRKWWASLVSYASGVLTMP
ncbi:hypothetical protein HPG69_010477, partial [Diceros bicornis minor]